MNEIASCSSTLNIISLLNINHSTRCAIVFHCGLTLYFLNDIEHLKKKKWSQSTWNTCVYLWRIHVDIWQNQYNIVKLKNKITLKKKYIDTILLEAKKVSIHAHTYPLSHVQLFETPWTLACQAPLSMEFSRHEYWNGLKFPSPGALPNSGIKPTFPVVPAVQADSLPLSHWENPKESTGLVNLEKIICNFSSE